MSWWRRPRWVKAVWISTVLAVAAFFVVLGELDKIDKWASALALFVGLLGLLADFLSAEPPAPTPEFSERLRRAAEDLAAAVREQWRAEERFRRLQDPFPLPVRWTMADPLITDHWANIRRQSGNIAPLDVAGELADVLGAFDTVPSKRLVVLGKPGAGKTVLTLRLVLQILEARRPGDRVPVLFSLASWRPGEQSLRSWMSERVAKDFPALSATAPSGATWATELMDHVLPVLDGLDEMPESSRPDAIRHLNATLDLETPVILTSRTDEYRRTIESADVFTAAAVIELQPLSLDQLVGYLPFTTRRTNGEAHGALTTKWTPVLDYLRESGTDAVAQALIEVLSTPLMSSMARVAYSDTSADPLELIDIRFADTSVLEKHLLNSFVFASYFPHASTSTAPLGSARTGRYRPEQAQVWLTFLASHLSRLGTRDIAWWQYIHGVPRGVRGLAAGLVSGVLFGLVGGIAADPAIGFAYGLFFALAAGTCCALDSEPEPSCLEARFRGTAGPFLLRFPVGVVTGLALGTAFDFPGPIVLGLGLAFGLAVGLHVWLDVPANVANASTPLVVFRRDRTSALAHCASFSFSLGISYAAAIIFTEEASGGPMLDLPLGLRMGVEFGLSGAVAGAVVGGVAYGRLGACAYSPAGAVAAGLAFPPTDSVAFGLAVGLLFGLAVGFTVLSSRAWGVFLLGRGWLTVCGRQPGRLLGFLADAHRRGILRQTGGVYQFRHARLQERLAEQARAGD
ncbi:NACHT domain-containing protein [Streptomyces sp. S.PNR 29]|uniref:NACHT domain-containing protein n=1 Tax=Streptomyces sp. S.PNR 29 TaxID=2973805 RepID=UPI0025B2466F|nr:NACHT domain-containing protein [Streptomyces sp. S.PNR 29]